MFGLWSILILVVIGSGNGFPLSQWQGVTWNNADLLSIRPMGTHYSEISLRCQIFSSKKIYLDLSSINCWPFYSSHELTLWVPKMKKKIKTMASILMPWAVLLKYGRPVAKCDPWTQRVTQGPTMDCPFGDQCILYDLQKNILEEKWTDNSADALISYPWFSTRLQYLHC